MAFVSYPSTPNFAMFMKNLRGNMPRIDGSDLTLTQLPKATFLGTVKLHGTNASILCQSGPTQTITYQFQSRNRIITGPDDNAGAVAFFSRLPMSTLINEILGIRKVKTFEEIFIAGEWAGTGIQKGVAVASLERFFAIFNIQIDGHWVDMREYRTVHLPNRRVYNITNFRTYEVDMNLNDKADCERGYNAMKEHTLDVVKSCPVGADLLQADGLRVVAKKNPTQAFGGEGIVWTMVPDPEFDTVLFNFKTKGEQFAPVNSKATEPRPGTKNPDLVAAFVDYALGERRMEQGIEYLQEMGKDSYDMKNLGEFMKWVMEDVIKEEGWKLDEREGDGPSLKDRGVTESDVKKTVGRRAREWYIAR